MKRRTLLQAATALALPVAHVSAELGFPTKTIRYIVPVAVGGAVIWSVRTVTERWGRILKQVFVVENIGGGDSVMDLQGRAR